jgi:uncharacterized protein involved in response to NO
MLTGFAYPGLRYAPGNWHVHEMVFGFLPAVITGFVLTAIPNWSERAPIRGTYLALLLTLWLAGRVVIAVPWFTSFSAAIVDGAFLVVVAATVWREIAAGNQWSRWPLAALITLYAGANILFHILALQDEATDLAVRMALASVMVLLALIGGRVTPNFTLNFMAQKGMANQPPKFSRIDGLSVLLVAGSAIAWIAQPQAVVTGWILLAAGLANLCRLSRWYGWLTWREPLVLILHFGYGWLVVSLFALGGASLGWGLPIADAVHALTTGAVGVMTLAIMTRASLGHTGRPLHASPLTVAIYLLVNLGAALRVFGPLTDIPTTMVLSVSAISWSGAYILFAIVYGPYLLRPSTNGH